MAQGHYADAIVSYQRAIDLGQKDAGTAAIDRMCRLPTARMQMTSSKCSIS